MARKQSKAHRSPEKPKYQCDGCGRRFKSEEELDAHEENCGAEESERQLNFEP